MGNLLKRFCYCLFPEKPKPMDEDMYNRIMNYRRETIEEENFKIQSEENSKFLYGNLR